MRQTTINKDIRELIVDKGGQDALDCCQCGKCFGLCPWNELPKIEYFTYRLTQAVKLGDILNSEDKDVIDAEVEEVYRCVGCEACSSKCPHGVKLSDVLRAVRRLLAEYGSLPAEIKAVNSKLFNVGNPLGEPRERRAAWAEGLSVPLFKQGMEFAYAPCCMPAYDRRAVLVAQATARLLNAAGVSYGIIGSGESCCGESIRRVGAERVFQKLAGENRAAYTERPVTDIIVSSPHCLVSFLNDYPEMGLRLKPVHSSQVLNKLLQSKKLVPTVASPQKVIYHDPCTLGRQSGIYEEPRAVLRRLPGLELLEFKHYNREYGLCCGGGSGGLWLDRPAELRMANLRVKQAAAAGAQVIAVACPYCLLMFEDSIKTTNSALVVKDISELLAVAAGLIPPDPSSGR